MTVSHKDLTGTDLHEMKGASTATSGQVPIANGAGGTPFGKLTHTSLQTTGNPFGAQLLHVQEVQNSNASSSSGAPGSSGTAQLINTTVTNEIAGVSVGTYFITLPAGTYYCEGWATVALSSVSGSAPRAATYLYNSSTASILLKSTGTYVSVSSGQCNIQAPIHFAGRFTLSGTSDLAVYAAATSGSSASSFSALGSTVYTDVRFWKVA